MLDTLGKGFFVSHLGSPLVHFHLKFTTHPVNDDLQVKLTHTSHDGLTRSFIRVYLQGRIFFYQFGNSGREFILVSRFLRLNSIPDHRFGEIHGFENQRVLLIR
ncbi:hypothetical protein D9M69_674820 [compost metagenome]